MQVQSQPRAFLIILFAKASAPEVTNANCEEVIHLVTRGVPVIRARVDLRVHLARKVETLSPHRASEYNVLLHQLLARLCNAAGWNSSRLLAMSWDGL